MKILLLLSVPDPDLEIRGVGLGGLVLQTLRREGVSKNNFLGPLGFLYIYIYIIYIFIIYIYFLDIYIYIYI